MHRSTRPMLIASAVFVIAGGYIHLREWFDVYRSVPASTPGSAMVRFGFPLNAGASASLAVGLVFVATRFPRFTVPVMLASIGFQIGSLAFLIGSRTGSVFGWAEPVWTEAADQTRAVEIGALLTLSAALAIHGLARRNQRTSVRQRQTAAPAVA